MRYTWRTTAPSFPEAACFRRTISGCVLLLLEAGGCGPIVLTVDDTVRMEGHNSVLLAQLEREPVRGFRDGIENAPVRFYVDGKQVAEQQTSSGGRALAVAHLPDGAITRFEAEAVVDGGTARAVGTIFTWRDDRTIIAVDVDGTIADTDRDELIFDGRDDESKPLPGARECLCGLAQRFYIAYVSARPRFLLHKTQAWLNRQGFPSGPVITAEGLRRAPDPKRFKCEMLARLRMCWPNLLIGMGDTHADAEAYRASAMLAIVLSADHTERKSWPTNTVTRAKWRDLQRLFEVNEEFLSCPRKLAEAVWEDRASEALIVPPDRL